MPKFLIAVETEPVPNAPDPERAAAQYVERVRRALDYGETILSKK